MNGTALTAAGVAVDDTDLVAAVRRGDDRAFEQLYGRYHARVAAYVRGMVKDHARAEDVTQEVFFSALRRMRETERPIAFKAWIYEIARNACIDAYRRTSRAEELSYDVEGGLAPADSMRLVSSRPGPDAAVESKQRLDDLCGAFGGLSDTHHQILVLRELEGLSYREIGERLGMSRAAVESTLFRARRRLTEEYDELVSGRRCHRVQAIIAAAAEGMLGARDRRRLERHVTTCQACRRQALHLGVRVSERPSLAARIAGLLPFPLAFGRARGGSGAGGHSGVVAHASATLGAAAEPVAAAWSKALAAVAVLAVAGAGAGAVSKTGLPLPGLANLPALGGDGGERGGASGLAPAGGLTVTAPGATRPGGNVFGVRPGVAAGRRSGGGGGSRDAGSGSAPRQPSGSSSGGAASLLPGAPSIGAPSVPVPGSGVTPPAGSTGSTADTSPLPSTGGSGGTLVPQASADAPPGAPSAPLAADAPDAPEPRAPSLDKTAKALRIAAG